MAFLSDIKDITVMFGQFFTVMFGLAPFSVILVPAAEPRNRHGNPGKNKAFLFDLDIRVKPEYDRKMLALTSEHDGFYKIGGVIW